MITDNWHPLNMACGTRTVYPSEQNKELSSTFQPPEEGQSVQWLKCYDKHGDKDEDNSQKNVSKVKVIIVNFVWEKKKLAWMIDEDKILYNKPKAHIVIFQPLDRN